MTAVCLALREAYDYVRRVFRAEGWKLPVNRGRDPDLKARERDCLVVNVMLDEILQGIQTVRAAFWEGERAFPGATFRRESHIQIAVRDTDCILGVFRPQLREGW